MLPTLSHRARRAIRLRNVAQVLLLDGRVGRARYAEFLAILNEIPNVPASAIQSARHAARGRHTVPLKHRNRLSEHPQTVRVRAESFDGHAVLVRGA